jgi:hypothetical protein
MPMKSGCRTRRRRSRTQGGKLRFEIVDAGDPHPNTCRLTLRSGRETHSLTAV